jgi:ABC-type glycerol-3-phosphate transport system substrate-binding protein
MKTRSLRIAVIAIILIAGVALGVHLMHKDALALPTSFRITFTYNNQGVEDLFPDIGFRNSNNQWIQGQGGLMEDQGGGLYTWDVEPPTQAVTWAVFLVDVDWIPVSPANSPWIVGGFVLYEDNNAGIWIIAPTP